MADVNLNQDRALMQRDLVESVRDVLGTMFFTEVLEALLQPPTGESSTSPLKMRICFQGESEGQLDLAIPPETAAALASSFMGLPEGTAPSQEEIEQVIQELSNILCGAFLTRQEPDSIFELSSPQAVSSESETAGSLPQLQQHLNLDSGHLSLRLFWKRKENQLNAEESMAS
jgi:CheY-specific phosphatase CheX